MHEPGGRNRWFKTQPGAIVLLTSPGAVMIHNGQEFGEDQELPGSGSGRVVPGPLRWSQHSPERGDFEGRRLFDIYARLLRIRKDHPALRSLTVSPCDANRPDGYGAFQHKDVVVFHRFGQADDGQLERFIVVINSSDFDRRIDIPFSVNGLWDDLLNDSFVFVDNHRLFNQRIDSNWGRIYYRKD